MVKISVTDLIDSLRRSKNLPTVVVINTCRSSTVIPPKFARQRSNDYRKKENKIWEDKQLLPGSKQNKFLSDPRHIFVVNAHGSMSHDYYIKNQTNLFYILPPLTGKILYNEHVSRVLIVLEFLLHDSKIRLKWNACRRRYKGLPTFKSAEEILDSWNPPSQQWNIHKHGRKKALWYSFLSRDNCSDNHARKVIQKLSGLMVGDLGSWSIFRPGDMMPNLDIDFYTVNNKRFFRGGINKLSTEFSIPIGKRTYDKYRKLKTAYKYSLNPCINHSLLQFTSLHGTLDYNIYHDDMIFSLLSNFNTTNYKKHLDLVMCDSKCIFGKSGPPCPKNKSDCKLIQNCKRCSRKRKCTV